MEPSHKPGCPALDPEKDTDTDLFRSTSRDSEVRDIQPRGYTLATPETPRRPKHHRTEEAHRG